MRRGRIKAGIGFVGVMTILFTFLFFHSFIYGHPVTEHLETSAIIMIFVYFIVGLAVQRQKGIHDMVDRIMYIRNNGYPAAEQLQLIRSFIEINVNKWVQYWHLYQEIVQGKEIKGKIKRLLMRIPRGSLSLGQFVWIMIYILYNVFKPQITLLAFITPDMTFVIDIMGLGFFIITSSNVIGTEEFLKIIFESIRPDEEKSVEQTLRLIESNIIYGAREYGFRTKDLHHSSDMIDENLSKAERIKKNKR
jgi:hypothetical protein